LDLSFGASPGALPSVSYAAYSTYYYWGVSDIKIELYAAANFKGDVI
jgi:hypothetical protein